MPTLQVVGTGSAGQPPEKTSVPAAPGGVRVLHEKAAFRQALAQARAAGRTIGLVPTMGAIHGGHASLIRCAAAAGDVVAVTVFVNPLQFERPDDLDNYPRTADVDTALAATAGATHVFVPTDGEMYGAGSLARVHVAGLGERLEGEARPGHFDGVATVCAKLFALAGPCRAFFGEKDFQQLAVVRRVVLDLDLPVEVVACPTVRAEDGLALASRNGRLTPQERAVAPGLHRALQRGVAAVTGGERDPAVVAAAVASELALEPLFRLDRVDVVDAATLAAPDGHTTSLRILAAVFLGSVRLIDNLGAAI